ncbi:TraB/GumN family protein [Asticcacaulis sp.]|uniref:TraB/GumN family protein n=1 Tax=Asticcacaulis sp. TaxID=1872648 RepID=UPI0031CE47D3
MMKTKILLTLAFVALAPITAWAQDDTIWSTTDVTVVKRLPGPALWKVVRDDKVVWIIGSAQIEGKAGWDSTRIENILTGAETLYTPPTASGGVSLIFRLMKDKDLPGRTTLKDVLPEAEYARFQVTARRYGIKTNDIEKDKPLWAGMRLSMKINQKYGYSSSAVVDRLSKVAKKKKVKVRAVASYEAKPLLNQIAAIDAEESRRCLTMTLDSLDYDIPNVPIVTKAWAAGDVTRLKPIWRNGPEGDCLQGLGADLSARVSGDTIAVIEKAMSGSKRSVLILPMGMLINDDWLVSGLRARGYQVREPL